MQASVGSQPARMGGVVHAAAEVPLRLDVKLERAARQMLEVIRSGVVVTTLDVADDRAALTCTLPVRPGQWVHVRLRDASGMTAFSNPVYIR
jgi:hypothetical protein